jgi:formylmethanofuran dehydrogenase subunit B
MPESMPDLSPAIPVTCPFCGLLCDDVTVRASGAEIKVVDRGCAVSRRALEQNAPDLSPRIGGRAAELDEAVAAAAALLANARQPLIGGLATDVTGMRAVMSLADRIGAVLDHMNAPAKFRNLLAVQEGGWITTTLAEVKNRADLVVLAGTDVVTRFPRFFERFVWTDETLFGLSSAQREVVYLGRDLDMAAGIAPDGRRPFQIPCDVVALGAAFGALRALMAGRELQAETVAGVPMAQWRTLADKLKSARYAVVVWAAADFDFPHAELTVRALCELIKDLNRSTRAAGLPLGGSDGDFTADGVELWQTGFPFRTGFGSGVAEYDPQRFATARLLAQGEADALLWIASFDERRAPPGSAVPTVVLGRPGMVCEREPEVFIPVGTPGVDHAGHLFRTDKVVMLPLRRLRESGLPSVARVVAAIEEAIAPC